MNIGDVVSYIRYGKDGFSEGTAVVKGIGLNGDKRAVVLLKDGEDSFNTFVTCVNPTPAFREKFSEGMRKIEEISKEGREKQQVVVDEYNALTGGIYDDLAGKQLEI